MAVGQTGRSAAIISLTLRQCLLDRSWIGIARRPADREPHLQPADLIVDEVDVYDLLTGRFAQLLKFEVSPVNGHAAHVPAPIIQLITSIEFSQQRCEDVLIFPPASH